MSGESEDIPKTVEEDSSEDDSIIEESDLSSHSSERSDLQGEPLVLQRTLDEPKDPSDACGPPVPIASGSPILFKLLSPRTSPTKRVGDSSAQQGDASVIPGSTEHFGGPCAIERSEDLACEQPQRPQISNEGLVSAHKLTSHELSFFETAATNTSVTPKVTDPYIKQLLNSPPVIQAEVFDRQGTITASTESTESASETTLSSGHMVTDPPIQKTSSVSPTKSCTGASDQISPAQPVSTKSFTSTSVSSKGGVSHPDTPLLISFLEAPSMAQADICANKDTEPSVAQADIGDNKDTELSLQESTEPSDAPSNDMDIDQIPNVHSRDQVPNVQSPQTSPTKRRAGSPIMASLTSPKRRVASSITYEKSDRGSLGSSPKGLKTPTKAMEQMHLSSPKSQQAGRSARAKLPGQRQDKTSQKTASASPASRSRVTDSSTYESPYNTRQRSRKSLKDPRSKSEDSGKKDEKKKDEEK